MPREPLYPHIAKRQEPQFPHTNPSPSVKRRVRVLAWKPPPPAKLAELRERLAARIGRRGRGHDVQYDERAYIVERRLQGLTIEEIAEELGRARSVIQRTLTESGIGLAEVKERLVASAEIQEGKDRRETMVRMKQAGFTHRQIGARFGIDSFSVRWHLYRAGQKIDLAEFERETTKTFYEVSDTLRGPITIPRLEKAAEALRGVIRDITNVEQLLHPGEIRLIRRPLEIRRLAEVARMVLLTGLWCLETAQAGVWVVEVRVRNGEIERVTRPIPAAAREHLGKCGPAAAQVARFVIEEVPGYVERAEGIFNIAAQLEEMMEGEK